MRNTGSGMLNSGIGIQERQCGSREWNVGSGIRNAESEMREVKCGIQGYERRMQGCNAEGRVGMQNTKS